MKGRRASVGVIAVFHLPGLCPLFSLGPLSSSCLCLPSPLSFQRIILYPHYFSIFPKLSNCLRIELRSTLKKRIYVRHGRISDTEAHSNPSEHSSMNRRDPEIKEQLVVRKDIYGRNHLW